MQNVIPNPVGYTRSGAYAVNLRSGVMAAGFSANSEIVHFRWTSTTLKAVVSEVSLWASVDTVAFTPGPFLFRLQQARSWSGDGTGGGTATLSGNNGKLRTEYPSTAVGTVRGATTGALGAGTKTLDANGIRELGGGTGAAAGTSLIAPASFLLGGNALLYPVVLSANEGLVITAVVPATGTWQFGCSIRWEETAGFPR